MREVYLRLQLLYYYPITWGGMLEIFKSKKNISLWRFRWAVGRKALCRRKTWCIAARGPIQGKGWWCVGLFYGPERASRGIKVLQQARPIHYKQHEHAVWNPNVSDDWNCFGDAPKMAWWFHWQILGSRSRPLCSDEHSRFWVRTESMYWFMWYAFGYLRWVGPGCITIPCLHGLVFA